MRIEYTASSVDLSGSYVTESSVTDHFPKVMGAVSRLYWPLHSPRSGYLTARWPITLFEGEKLVVGKVLAQIASHLSSCYLFTDLSGLRVGNYCCLQSARRRPPAHQGRLPLMYI